MKRMKIAELARASGVTASAIRYYESVGLLPPATRAGAAYRSYGREDVERVGFIRRCRALGFSLREIGEMQRSACADPAHAACGRIVERRLSSVRMQLARLQAVEARLLEVLGA